MEIAFLIWILCGIAAAIIGNQKGEGCAGFILGFVLGPIGLLLAIFSSGNRKPCPFCKEMIHNEATVCPRCQRDLAQPETPKSDPLRPPSPAVYSAAKAAGRAVRSLSYIKVAVIVGVLLLYLYFH